MSGKETTMFRSLTAWQEFFQAMILWIHNFFNPKLEGYTNFDFGNGILSLQIIIFGIFAGVLLASFYTIYIRTTLGKIVRALLEKEALSPENAMTLSDCGLERNPFIRHAILHGYTLNRVIHCVEKEEYEASLAETTGKKPNFKKNALSCHFYIPEENRITAEMRFRERGSGYLTFFFVAFVSLLCVILIFALLPQLIAFFDNVISLFSLKGNMHQ